MPLYQIQNEHLTIRVKSLGAELCSVISNNTSIEYIWQADSKIWARHAPNLFPIVGKLKNGTYTFQNKWYQLPQHGFARDLDFECIEQSENHLKFELTETKETLSKFPFRFTFQITYTLEQNSITVNYAVFNPDETDMYFSVGAHPAFNCPFQKNENFEDYELIFPDKQELIVNQLQDGLISKETQTVALSDPETSGEGLAISKSLFDKDALVLMNSQINEVQLVSKKTKNGVTLKCKNWPYFGIWTKPNTEQFICLEPWFGIADFDTTNGDLINKTGIIKLKPKQNFNCSYSMCFLY